LQIALSSTDTAAVLEGQDSKTYKMVIDTALAQRVRDTKLYSTGTNINGTEILLREQCLVSVTGLQP